jgi:hypothetical protein
MPEELILSDSLASLSFFMIEPESINGAEDSN